MFQTKVFIALGSNIGDKISNIKKSIHEIKKYGKVVNYGDIYISKPYGFKNQQNFFNTAILFLTNLQPMDLIKKLSLIETKLKKNKKIENGPRKIDIDIIFYGKQNIANKKLTIPHPRAHLRDFVLRPIADIDSNFIHPTKKISIRNLISQLDENFTFRKLSNRNLR